jgi:hypothetical protein
VFVSHVYMFRLVLMMSGHPRLTHQLVYSTAGQIKSNFVPSLFVICVIFFLDAHVNFLVIS